MVKANNPGTLINTLQASILPPMAPKRLFSPAEVADRLGVCRQRVWQIAVDMGVGQRVGTTTAYTAAEVARMERRRTELGRPVTKG